MLTLTRRNLWLVPTAGGIWMFAFWFFLLAGAVNYRGLGTFEFLVDEDHPGRG